jgi:UDP-2,4-diacetamido-2,4,6-trideoxy-beta-L-altropyranose hydrolase
VNGPRIVLRAKSGPNVGMGHVMRTRAVAEAVAALGGAPVLIVDDDESARRLRSEGLEARSVLERPGWDREPAAAAWLDGFVDWSDELRTLARKGTRTFLVENRTPAREFCHCLVYPALHHEPDAWDRVHAGRVLAGPGWIPLRREVVEAQPEPARDVDLLITFGGSDPLGSTERVLGLLEARGRRIVVSVGPHMAERRRAIEEAATRLQAEVLPTGCALAPWFARSRAAVTALGTTLYELAYLGVPALVLANYPSDRDALAYYEVHGPHAPLGVAPEMDDASLGRALEGGWEALRRGGEARIDDLGSGARRLAEALLAAG